MTHRELRSDLHGYLRDARETLAWKLDGLGEYDIRRPMTPTGTNLLGLLKHSASTHVRYFGGVFTRTGAPSLPWRHAGSEPNADFWAAADETRQDILDICRQAWAFADATISDLSLDAVGRVPWWGDSAVTLHNVLVHVTADTQRHAGHADIVRELIDGSAGLLEGHDNLPSHDRTWWNEHWDRVESAARAASRS
jgi:hypothetical protein